MNNLQLQHIQAKWKQYVDRVRVFRSSSFPPSSQTRRRRSLSNINNNTELFFYYYYGCVYQMTVVE